MVTVLDQAGVGAGVGGAVGDGVGLGEADGSGDAEGLAEGDDEGAGDATRVAPDGPAGVMAPIDQLSADRGVTTARAGLTATASVSTASTPDHRMRTGWCAGAAWPSLAIDMLRVWLVRPATGHGPIGRDGGDAGTSMAPSAVPCT